MRLDIFNPAQTRLTLSGAHYVAVDAPTGQCAASPATRCVFAVGFYCGLMQAQRAGVESTACSPQQRADKRSVVWLPLSQHALSRALSEGGQQ